ncbi:DNA polymerase III catalytic subunit PolC type [Tissierella praeacuta]|uniref:DNA polymerase III subunit alpha n=1 Tax=Tissierella praeacuta TaxID=43131 RepID=UPI00104DD40C|nr:DNA polymerase III subunit alpha [Tissierella praeacuta]TCU75805.1 DNA polymerase III catalytic subunit PolC type [Tissierella praeacuta]
MKRINEIFNDYEIKGNINTAIVEGVVLRKNEKILEMKIRTDKFIQIREIEELNKFIKERFSLNDSKIIVEYAEEIDKIPREEELRDIICVMSDKYPVLKAIINNCEFEVFENTINFNFEIPASGILISMGYDKEINKAIKSLYNTEYEINFIDKVCNEKLKKLQEDVYSKEIMLIQKEAAIQQNNNISKSPKEISRNQDVKAETNNKKNDPFLILGRSSKIKDSITKITDITPYEGKVAIEGEISNIESRELKSGKILVSFDLYDGSSSITCKSFIKGEDIGVLDKIKNAKGVRLSGNAAYSKFSGEVEIIANTIIETEGIKRVKRDDNAELKRVELHMHTQMSQMDAMTSATDLINRAMSWGMKSIAITDHGVVQAFPEAHKLLGRNNPDMKVIYGVEAYLVPDKKPSVTKPKGQGIDTTYCVLDLETTGFSPVTEKITEIGIMKLKDGEVIDKFSTFVNPEKPIPQRVVEITNITDDMVRNAETIDKIFPKMLDFINDSVLVAHNADFDINFLRHNAKILGYEFDFTYVDTLSLAREIFPDFKSYKLGRIAKNLGIKVEVAHRALDDVDTTVKVFNIMIERLKELGAETLEDIDICASSEESKKEEYKKLKTYHAIILAKNYIGLKNLYKLVSYSHLDYFYKRPRILKSLYRKYSEGLILGSACSEGELYQSILLGKPEEEIESIAKEYDYLEIQPLGNNDYLIRNGQVENIESLKEINRKIVGLGEKLNKPVVATGDVHFLDPEDEIYRRILETGQGYKDADNQAPLYLKTTEEMLQEFSYLGREKAYEVVITNTNMISDMCEQISPISSEKATPHIEGCEQTIRDITYGKAHELYGNPLPEIVQERLDRELDSIIKNGFSVMYIIAQKLVWKSNEDGYLVGSRGSVGSSVVAYMTGITEVNALPPHYRCTKCKHSDFADYGYKLGFDLPDKLCPVCGENLTKDGIDIPFETFLGFNGDKEPDIDLNFSGEYQAKAHRYTEVIFGKGTTFKAGTIGTIAEKTAFGYVKKYFEEKNISANKAEILRISRGCTGIKRTTGQHPGGIIVVPKGREIFEFCPVQHPADDTNSDIITTHFDYHSIDENLLKLDILGHDDPTVIRMLQDITGVDPQKIPMDDKKTMSIFSSTEALGVTPEQINSKVGTFGIPEFGTRFVRGMLLDTMPKTFMDLICISGLSHGTDVWLGNAKELIDSKIITSISEAVCTRDDIMVYLIKKGLPPNTAFKIMETVRKGKALKDPKWAEYENLMREFDVPEWYINSCKKIKYMFPKAHAAAYVMMAFRIAWFKVHIPRAYYAAYFSIRAKAFDAEFMIFGKEKVKEKMKEIESLGNDAAPKDKDMYDDLELVLEMYERGINFLPIDLYKSHATKFLLEGDSLRPPINSIPGMGTVAAEGIYKSAQEEPFSSIEDLRKRAKIGNAAIDSLKKFDCLRELPESDQISFFDAI